MAVIQRLHLYVNHTILVLTTILILVHLQRIGYFHETFLPQNLIKETILYKSLRTVKQQTHLQKCHPAQRRQTLIINL